MPRRLRVNVIFLSGLLVVLVACAGSGARVVPSSPPAPVAARASLEDSFRQGVYPVTTGVWVAIGFGIANVIVIEAPEGLIIVDTLESVTQALRVREAVAQVTSKPIKALIYTHNHPDHVYGAAAFDPDHTLPVYAHATTAEHMDKLATALRPAMSHRAAHMYGTLLKGSDLEHVGIGPFVGMYDDNAVLETRRPTQVVQERLETTIAGEPVTLLHAPGETDDQLYVWLPQRRVLLPGDNFYRAFPNLYTLRGTSWRDPVQWYRSLDIIRTLRPAFLVPSHTQPVVGEEEIYRTITDYRDAIQYVHDQTLRGLNAGQSPDALAATVLLPPHLASAPYLQEVYGSVSWSVRGIYAGYLGWYDGSTTALRPMIPKQRAEKWVALGGGFDAVLGQAQSAIEAQDWQWGLELTDALLELSPKHPTAVALRIQALKSLGLQDTNPNAKHWYLTEALELEKDIVATVPSNPTPAFVHAIPTRKIFESLIVNLHAEDTLTLETAASFVFPDSGEAFTIRIRRGVAELSDGASPDAALTVTVPSTLWKEMLAGLRSRVAVLASGQLTASPGLGEFASFMKHFVPK